MAGDAAPTASAYRELAEIAPVEIRDDMQRFATWLEELQAMDSSEVDSADSPRSKPEYRKTIRRITGYLRTECGIGTEAADVDFEGTEGEPAGSDASADAGDNEPNDVGSDPPSPPDIPEGNLGGVPEEDVKTKMIEVFGDRVWGFSAGASHDELYDYEGNIAELEVDEALAACRELSLFLAHHPDANGTAVLRLTDFPRSHEFNLLALNERVIRGDAGRCESP